MSNEFFFQSGSNVDHDLIPNSLRFRGSQYLERSVTTESNRASWSFSCWMKRGQDNAVSVMFGVSGDSFNIEHLQFGSNNQLNRYIEFGNQKSGYNTYAYYRDQSAWYHVLWVNDMAEGSASNRTRVYVNGEQMSMSWTQAGAPSPAPASLINTIRTHFVGRGQYTGTSYPMYMAEVHFVESQLLPTDFGEYDDNGVWIPKEVSGLTYGTNGFYLDFSDPGNIGADRSGNGNNYSPVGFELTDTSSTNYDWMADSPTKNYQTLNPLSQDYRITKANRSATGGAPTTSKLTYSSTFNLPTEGKWYAEFNYDVRSSDSDAGFWCGVCSQDSNPNTSTTAKWERAYRMDNGNKLTRTNASASESAFGASCTAGDRIGVAVDMDNGYIWFAKNNVWQGGGNPATGANPAFTDLLTADYVRFSASIRNRDITFVDGGGQVLSYAPPSGFSTLSSETLPNVAITNPSEHFAIRTWMGTGANQSIDFGMEPDFVWIKSYDHDTDHVLVSTILPDRSRLRCNTEPLLTSANGDGYTNITGTTLNLNSEGGGGDVNTNGRGYIGWAWKAGGTAVTNNAGTQTSQVSANTEAGFSVATFSGNASQSNPSFGHGLSQAPDFVWVKPTNATTHWRVYHSTLLSTQSLKLNTGGGISTEPVWGGATTSSVVRLGPDLSQNATNYIAMCWYEVPGFSSFGSYVGNGSSDGSFVYTGFRPAYVLIKNTSTQDWMILDAERNTYNPVDYFIHSNTTQRQYNSYGALVDFTANGFKLRSNNDRVNSTNSTFIYAAFAEHPFGGKNVYPSPAR